MTTVLSSSVKLPAASLAPLASLPGSATSASVDDDTPLFIDVLNIVEQAQVDADPNTSAPAQHASEDAVDAEKTLPGMSMLMPPAMMLVPLPDMQVMNDVTAPGAAADALAAAAPVIAAAAVDGSDTAAAVNTDAGVPKTAGATVIAATIGDTSNTSPLPQHMRAPLSAGIAHDAVSAASTVRLPTANTDNAASDVNLHVLQLPVRDDANPTADRDQKTTVTSDLSPRTAVPSSMPQQAAGADIIPVSSAKLAAAPATQAHQPLVEVLGERIRVQLGQRIEHAVIRLDPPMMGTIEVVIRHEAGVLQVQLSASHNDVLRQLHNIGDSLRLDLAHRQYTDVSVLVSNGMRDGDGRQRPRHAASMFEEPGLALAEAGEESTTFSLLN